jgi:RND family efflux transporter MFP subunit
MKAVKRLVILAILAAIGYGAFLGYKQATKPTVHPVREVALKRQQLQSTLSAVGYLSSRDELSLSSPISSTIGELTVELGSRVDKDQVLVRFDPKDFAQRLAAAQASEREAASELRNAQRNYRSLVPVVKAGGEPQQSLRDARSKLGQLRAKTDRLRAQSRALETERGNFELRAPVQGVVVKLDVRAGQYLTVGRPILSLVPTDNLTIRARIDQSVSAALAKGTPIEVSSESQPDKKLNLRIDSIDPAVEREGSSSYVIAWVGYDPNSELKLRLNQQVDLSVVTESRDDALALPLEGLVTQGDEEFVRVIRDGKVKLLPVKTGIQDGGVIEVVMGLTGDEVIVVPLGRNVREGARVRLVKQ